MRNKDEPTLTLDPLGGALTIDDHLERKIAGNLRSANDLAI